MKKQTINLERVLEGSILDVGGGGEGIIGRLYGPYVTAIDKEFSELSEIKDSTFEKICMNAENLDFEDSTFSNVTFFYSLMYMEKDIGIKALKEAIRVLKQGGQIHIWDVLADNILPRLQLADLTIRFAGIVVNTTYGAGKRTNILPSEIQKVAELSNLSSWCKESDDHYRMVLVKELHSPAADSI